MRMPFQDGDLPSVCAIPDADGTIVACGGENSPVVVWRPRDTNHAELAPMRLESPHSPPLPHLPHPNPLVIGARSERFPVGGPRDAVDCGGVPGEVADNPARRDVPQTDRIVPRSRSQDLCVRRPRQAQDNTFVRFESLHQSAACPFPEPDCGRAPAPCVGSARSQPLAIWRPRNTEDLARMPSERANESPGFGVPEANRLVGGWRRNDPPIRRPCDPPDPIGMPAEGVVERHPRGQIRRRGRAARRRLGLAFLLPGHVAIRPRPLGCVNQGGEGGEEPQMNADRRRSRQGRSEVGGSCPRRIDLRLSASICGSLRGTSVLVGLRPTLLGL